MASSSSFLSTSVVVLVVGLLCLYVVAAAESAPNNLDPVTIRLRSHRAVDVSLRSDVQKLKFIHQKLHEHKKLPRISQQKPINPPFDSLLGGSVWPTGGYFAEIFVGTPLQPQLVQIDTGSSDLLVAQVGCNGCPSGDSWDPSASSTSTQIACSNGDTFNCAMCEYSFCYFNNTYQTCDFSDPDAYCSLIGPTFTDMFSLSTGYNAAGPVAEVGFGGITLHSGAVDNEWTNMPGVMGMAFPSLSGVWLRNTVFDSLVATGGIDNVFGMCLGPNGGHMTFGGYNTSLFTGDLQYSPLVEEMWYVIQMTDLGIDGVSLGLDSSIYNRIGGGTILDSGTYNLVVAGEAYDVLFYNFVSVCSKTSLTGICDVMANQTLFSGACYPMVEEDLAAYPNISIRLNGVDRLLNLQPKDYLIEKSPLMYCLGIQSSGVGGFTILGNVFQQPFYIVFDRTNSQLGFADASSLCSEGSLP